MKVEKTIKKIRKAIGKNPDVRDCLVDVVDGGGHFQVGAKNKAAFRFFRDQLDGDDAKAVNHVYGIGGRMDVFYGDSWITFALFDEHGKKYGRVELGSPKDLKGYTPRSEPEAADDENYALPA